MSNTTAALTGMALLFAFALAGTMDRENHNHNLYCEMTALYAESNGQNGWPPYEESVQCP